jgi:hypothetical protein
LWKATKKIKHVTQPSPPLRTPLGTWASNNVEKAQAFANHLANVFHQHPSENQSEEEEALTQLLGTPYQLKTPEVQEIINSLNPKKSPGYDIITGQILKALPTIGIKYLTQIFNAALLIGYFSAQWKVA